MGFDLLVEVAELGVAVGILFALQGLGVALQAETLGAQHIGHGVGTDTVSLGGEFVGQVAGGECRPAQW